MGKEKLNKTLLGGLTPQEFLRDYWQKKPLLVRNAIPGFQGLLSRDELIDLASDENVQSRLVCQKQKKWSLKHGPLETQDFSGLPKNQWTLLVQEVNHFLPSARDLLLKFNFIPYARLDDLMVSYAPKGGGIGPHFDSYDVFLLQGQGSRRWQVSTQPDKRELNDVPLKILQNFDPEQEWLLESGDMLYLPPNYAHNGVAVNDCMTYSIGFRAPSHHELVTQFLVYLQDYLEIEGWYTDPKLRLQSEPANISPSMLHQTQKILKKIKWERTDIENFLGIYLTEPKTHVFFNPPEHPLSIQKFVQQVEKGGVELNLKSRMLIGDDGAIFLNGEFFGVGIDTYQNLTQLANEQILYAQYQLNKETRKILYQWYLSGYIELSG